MMHVRLRSRRRRSAGDLPAAARRSRDPLHEAGNRARVRLARSAHGRRAAGPSAALLRRVTAGAAVIQAARNVNATRQGVAAQYEVDDFTYNSETRERPTKAVIYPKGLAGGAVAPVPIAFHKKGDSGTVDSDIKKGWHRGHVAAFSIGGDNASYNIAPMKPGFNRGSQWRTLENAVGARAKISTYGKYRVTISLAYGNVDGRIPSAVTVKQEAQQLNGSWATIGTDQTLAHQAAVTTAPTGNLKTLLARNPTSAEVQDYLGGHLPQDDKTGYPDRPQDRPYEHLDFKWMAGNLPNFAYNVSKVGRYREFSEEQRSNVVLANLAKNNGTLKSDDSNDPHQTLDENGTADFPEVDHIIPKSAGGSNLFSNARLVSWELNNKVARVKGIAHLVDMSRLATSAARNLQEAVYQAFIRAPSSGITTEDLYQYLQINHNVGNLTKSKKEKIAGYVLDLRDNGEIVFANNKYKRAV